MSNGNHYAQEAKRMPIPICPKCGSQANEIKTQYGLLCKCCDLRSWDRYPLADDETHKARNEAHKAFDSLWRKKKMGRSDAYARLATELNIHAEDCHMKLMDAATARRVPAAVAAIKNSIGAK